jgi:hypothetical protein
MHNSSVVRASQVVMQTKYRHELLHNPQIYL